MKLGLSKMEITPADYLPYLKKFQVPESDLHYETDSYLFLSWVAIHMFQDAEKMVS